MKKIILITLSISLFVEGDYLAHPKSQALIDVAKMFNSKIKFLPKRLGERFASSLTDKTLSNKMHNYFGRISLKNYINDFISRND